MLRVAITHPLRAVLVGGKVSVLGSFPRFVRRGVPCEAWRPMTTPRPTRPAAGRGAGRAKVGAVCRGAAGAACGAEGAAFVVEARSGFLFLHNFGVTQEPFTRGHLILDTV